MKQITEEQLIELGFVFDIQEGGMFAQWEKKYEDGKVLVIAVAPMPEFFVWLPDPDAADIENDGVRIYLDTDDMELAVKAAEIIMAVE